MHPHGNVVMLQVQQARPLMEKNVSFLGNCLRLKYRFKSIVLESSDIQRTIAVRLNGFIVHILDLRLLLIMGENRPKLVFNR